MTFRITSILVSPRVKAMMEPMIIPQMPPSATPSRNMRLRKNVIFVTFSYTITAGIQPFLPHSRDALTGNIRVVGVALTVKQSGPLFPQLFVNGLSDGLDLTRIVAAADDEVICDGCNLSDV